MPSSVGIAKTQAAQVAAKVMKKPLYPQDSKVARKVWHEFTREIHILAMAQGHEGPPQRDPRARPRQRRYQIRARDP